VLAALIRPQRNYCAEALDVMAEVRAAYGADPDIAGIVSAAEAICADLGVGQLPAAATALPSTLEPDTPALTPTSAP
jgi:hypothetical protein